MSLETDFFDECILLEMGGRSIERFASLPLSLQKKIREKAIESTKRHSPEALTDFSKAQIQRAINEKLPDWMGNLIEFETPKVRASKSASVFMSEAETYQDSYQEAYQESYQKTETSSDFPDNNIESHALKKKDYSFISKLPVSVYSREIKDLGGGQIKLEITSGREMLGCMAPVAVLVLAGVATANALPTLGIIIAVLGLPPTIYLRLSMDDYLIAEPEKQMIYNYRKLFSNEEKIPLIPFNEITTLAVKARKQQNKNTSWWEYQPIATSKNGYVIELGDFKKANYSDAVAFTKGLAEGLGLQFTKGLPEVTISVEHDGKVRI